MYVIYVDDVEDRSKSCLSRSFSNSSRAIRCLVASQSALLRPISHVAFSNSAFDLPSSLCDASNLISKRSRSLTARSSRKQLLTKRFSCSPYGNECKHNNNNNNKSSSSSSSSSCVVTI
uniref:Uncharacterized protein n=1 Tax=Glossina austeni TaxID=7395 RepID=A0A1A9V7L5_GLOAU